MRSFVPTLILATALSALSGAALADNPLPISPLLKDNANSGDSWSVSASPYIWAASLSGKAGQFGQPASKIDSSFSKIFSDLDLAFMGAIEARRQRVSLLGDVMYSRLSVSGKNRIGVLSKEVDITSKSFSGFLGAGYSVAESDRGHLDVVGGGLLWYASTEISLKGGRLDGKGKRDSATWIDAVVGLRGRYMLDDSWFVTGWGLVGAGQARLDWDATAAFGYQFKNNFSAVLGYRALGVNYNRNGFIYNVVQQGPIMGLAYRF